MNMATAIHIEINVLSLLILCMIVWQSTRNVSQQMSRILFDYTVYSVIAVLILDSIWVLIDGAQFPGALALNRVVNALYLGLGVPIGGLWYLYVLESLGWRITKAKGMLIMLPGAVCLALNLISMWTGWIFFITEDNFYMRGPLFWFQIVCALGMLMVSFVHILIFSIRKSERVSRRYTRKLLGFYIIPFIGTLVAIPYAGMPGTWTSAAVSLVLIYLDGQDREILRDSLTGLNNRKALDGIFADYAKITSPEKELTLFMLDLDDFKGINDRYGHPEGDRALRETARILRVCVRDTRSIVARYGGDEFLIMGFFPDGPAAFCDKVRLEFDGFNLASGLPYKLNTSLGYAVYEEGQSLQGLVATADAELYKDKEKLRKKKGRGANRRR